MNKLKTARVEKLSRLLKELGAGKNKVAECLYKKKIKGKINDCYECPVAIFLKKNFPKALEVEVDGNNAFVIFAFHIDSIIYQKLPKAVQDFIYDFDAGVKYEFLKK